MINLLPQKEKALIHKEYLLRRIALYLAILFILAIIAGILLIPSYILSFSRRNAAESTLSQPATESQQQNTLLMNQIQKTKSALVVLAPENPVKLPTDIIGIITKHKTPQITVNDISYKYIKPNSFIVSIKGLAKTRQSLTSFKASLEQEPGIAEIILPISNLAKDSNIEFSFEIKNKQ
jgi:hypothetical protein